MTDLTRDDLRVEVPIDWRGNSPRTETRPLTAAERDAFGRAWLREKIGDVEELRQSRSFVSFDPATYTEDELTVLRAVDAVLAILHGAQE